MIQGGDPEGTGCGGISIYGYSVLLWKCVPPLYLLGKLSRMK